MVIQAKLDDSLPSPKQVEYDRLTAKANELQADRERAQQLAGEISKQLADIMAQRTSVAREIAAETPVDRAAVTLTDGSPVPADRSHTEHTASGQQKGYIVLSDAERAKGFVRPVRDAYRHVGAAICGHAKKSSPAHWEICALLPGHKGSHSMKIPGEVGSEHYERAFQRQLLGGCGLVTTMGRALAETYARDPKFYSGTFCSTCRKHFPVGADGEFVWLEMDGREVERVGT